MQSATCKSGVRVRVRGRWWGVAHTQPGDGAAEGLERSCAGRGGVGCTHNRSTRPGTNRNAVPAVARVQGVFELINSYSTAGSVSVEVQEGDDEEDGGEEGEEDEEGGGAAPEGQEHGAGPAPMRMD